MIINGTFTHVRRDTYHKACPNLVEWPIHLTCTLTWCEVGLYQSSWKRSLSEDFSFQRKHKQNVHNFKKLPDFNFLLQEI